MNERMIAPSRVACPPAPCCRTSRQDVHYTTRSTHTAVSVCVCAAGFHCRWIFQFLPTAFSGCESWAQELLVHLDRTVVVLIPLSTAPRALHADSTMEWSSCVANNPAAEPRACVLSPASTPDSSSPDAHLCFPGYRGLYGTKRVSLTQQQCNISEICPNPCKLHAYGSPRRLHASCLFVPG